MARKKSEVKSVAASDLDEFIAGLAKSVNKKEDPVEKFISTGSTVLDMLIANKREGGIPVSRLTEITGEESSGKTLLAAHVLANTQKMGGIAVYIDTEHAVHKDFFLSLGVRWDKLIRPRPETIEEVFETIERFIKLTREKYPSKDVPVTIVWDSIAATPSKAEIEGDYDANGRMGVSAKAMSQGMRKLTSSVDYGYVTLVFLNQLRYRMNLENKYADPWVAPYGKAVPFHASVRLRLEKFTTVKEDDENKNDKDKDIVGIKTRAKIVKSKISPPLRKAEFPIMFQNGIDDATSIYEWLHGNALIEKNRGVSTLTALGKTHEFKHEEWKDFLAKNKEYILDVLQDKIVVAYDINDPNNVDEPEEEEDLGNV